MCTRAWDSVAPIFVAVDQNVAKIIIQAELQKTVTGACDCETVLGVMIHNQTMCFCAVTETAIVVSTSTGTVLDSQNIIVVVHHLMQQCGADFFNGAGKGTCSDVDFMGGTLLADPGIIPQGEVAIGSGRGLDGDGGP